MTATSQSLLGCLQSATIMGMDSSALRHECERSASRILPVDHVTPHSFPHVTKLYPVLYASSLPTKNP